MKFFCIVIILVCFIGNSFGQNPYKSNVININNGLTQNTVTSLITDDIGRLWIGTQNKLQYFNGYEVKSIQLINNRVMNLFINDSSVYCVSTNKLVKINFYNLKEEVFEFEKIDFYQSKQTDSGIELYSPTSHISLNFDYNLKQLPIKNEYSFDTQNVNFESYYIVIKEGKLFITDAEKKTVSINSGFCNKMLKYEKSVYVATFDGLIKLQLKNDSILKEVFFKNESFEVIHFDENDNLWAGTSHNGLFMIHNSNLKAKFHEVLTKNDDPAVCWKVFSYENKTFVCTSEGIMCLSNLDNVTILEKITKNIHCLTAFDCNEFLLVGTLNKGLFKFEENKFTQVYKGDGDPLSSIIVQIIKQEKGYLVLTKKEALILDSEGRLIEIKPFNKNKGSYIMYLKQYNSNLISCETNGVRIVDNDFKTIKKYPKTKANVFSMFLNHNNTEWLVSLDDGLYHLENDSIKKDTFPEINLYTIQAVDSQKCWISSSTSIYSLNKGEIRPYSSQNGFPLKEYEQFGNYIDSFGKLYYSGVGGVYSFYQNEVIKLPALPKVIVKSNSKLVDIDLINLSFQEAYVSFLIEPVLLSDKNLFEIKYKINGNKWIGIDKEKLLNIELNYGENTLELTISNLIDGESKYRKIEIIRAFPFWQKLWFKIVVVILIILLLIGLYGVVKYFQTNKKLKVIKEKQKVEKERLRISNELHDNIGARLTHIISSLDIEIYKNKELNSLYSINKFAKDTMSQLRETIWAVSEKEIYFSEFSRRVEYYINQLESITSETFIFKNNCKSDFELSPVEVINLYRIMQESINNAIKYANSTEISCSFYEDDAMATMEIKDNGDGFNYNPKQSRYNGIQNMKVRIEEIIGELDIQSEINKGTVIKVKFKK